MSMHKIVIGGDLLPSGINVSLFQKGDAKSLFGEEICNLFSEADYSLVNLEGPLTDEEKKQEKDGPSLKAPRNCAKGLKALGVKAVALANNHITDFGQKGFTDTLEVLNDEGIDYVGAGINVDKIKKFTIIDLDKIKVCIYNVSETFFNTPDDQFAGAHIYDEYIVCNEIKDLKKDCDYIIVIYHGGAEYLQYPTPLVRKRCHRMADSGADIIITQHTHCIGCEEYYKKSYILHGQGNFLFARQKKYPHLTKEGLLLELCFSEDSLSIFKHHVRIKDDVIRYDNSWKIDEFKSRSNRIDDEEMIIEEYKRVKVDEIMNKYLLAAKGTSIVSRLCLKFFPNYYMNRHARSYTRKQILMNLCVVGQDRRNEDMGYVWQYLLEHKQ